MRNTITFALLLASATTARADPADLGTPLPKAGAAPALSGVGIGAGLDTTYEATLPDISLAKGVSLPRRAATLGGIDLEEYVGGTHPGRFLFTTLRFDFDFNITGGADPFTVAGMQLDSGNVLLMRFGLPSIGIGYRGRKWLGTVQLTPGIEWFTADFETPAMKTLSGSDVSFALAVDAQLCSQWNMGGIFPKNAATCVYAAPIVYRDGFMTGASFGVRVFPF